MVDVPGKVVRDLKLRGLVDDASAAVLANHVEPKDDMIAERLRASFDSTALAVHLNGGTKKVKRKAELVEFLSKQPWGDKSQRYFHSRTEEYVNGLRTSLGIWDAMQEHNMSMADGLIMRSLMNFPGGLELHIGMWIPALMGQADEEQQAKWLPPSQRLELIGTYAQTELGHGTFVRGLETTATYDAASQQFVIHSPTLSATKWWPGGLGKTATHVLCMARLFLAGKDYGPHAFIVQIRSLSTHLPLPGIEVGDIGPKCALLRTLTLRGFLDRDAEYRFGYNGVDNGFLRFEYVCIPRENMLMRFSKVTVDGKYVPPPPANSKASFSTMTYVRATIVEDAGEYLARAVTIAVRYAAVRRQTAARPGERELQVLDYQNTSADLLGLVASAYALKFMGQAGMGMYKQFEQDRDRGDFSILPELHSTLSALKAVCTWITCDGIEICRRSCGGHGYSLLSGLPTIYVNYVQNATWEGDNNVLCLQTARSLLKGLVAAKVGKKSQGNSTYLGDVKAEATRRCTVRSAVAWLQPEAQLAALRHRASRLAVEAANTLAAASGGSALQFEGPAWNGCTVDMIRLAKAHAYLILQANFVSHISGLKHKAELSGDTVAALEQLSHLFGLSIIEKQAGDFMEDGYCSGEQVQWVRAAVYEQVRAVRPDAVALVDSFGFEDFLLNSAIGRKDGDVYRSLLEMAKSSPLNATEVGPAWKDVLEPRMGKAQAKL